MTLILGGGLAGLSAGLMLARGGLSPTIVERDSQAGGLARTLSYNGCRFDLGGHRFLTDDESVENLVRDIVGPDLITVRRKSSIYLKGRYIDYPLRPLNALLSVGPLTTSRIIADYALEKIRDIPTRPTPRSLEDWVVRQFGRTMFNLYFKEYSEKVWGMDCASISSSWVARRIDSLSLWTALAGMLVRRKRVGITTMADSFLYPVRGIGQIAESMAATIRKAGKLLTGHDVLDICHDGKMIRSVSVANAGWISLLEAGYYISTLPLTTLVRQLRPAPPAAVLRAAGKIGYRGLVAVTLITKKPRLTDLTWLYFPERSIPFGRIHEPGNWSREMCPEGRSHIVVEHFCNQWDETWSKSDEALIEISTRHLADLGFFSLNDVVDGCVTRVPAAYPVFDVNYQENVSIITDYLSRFSNLCLAGRTGTYSYLNMDAAIASGMGAAQSLIDTISTDQMEPELAMAASRRSP